MTGLGIILAILAASAIPLAMDDRWSEDAQTFFLCVAVSWGLAAIACGIIGALP